MAESIRQQIIISGVGGQGVLFVTRLLAEAAIGKGLSVYTSETHGMAQRGGTVLSHLKIGAFSSPLIRPSQADGLLILKSENLAQHAAFLKPGGWTVVNNNDDAVGGMHRAADTVDADALAQKIGSPKSVNLILLGFALGKAEQRPDHQANLFCSFKEITAILESRFSDNAKMLDAFLKAIAAGYDCA